MIFYIALAKLLRISQNHELFFTRTPAKSPTMGVVIKYGWERMEGIFFLTEIFSWPSEFSFQNFNAPAQNYRNFSHCTAGALGALRAFQQVQGRALVGPGGKVPGKSSQKTTLASYFLLRS